MSNIHTIAKTKNKKMLCREIAVVEPGCKCKGNTTTKMENTPTDATGLHFKADI